jgi:hypothetical protein
LNNVFSLVLVAVVLVGTLGLVGCDDPPQGFESNQAVCTSPGDCHVTRMPSDNDLGYTVRPQG